MTSPIRTTAAAGREKYHVFLAQSISVSPPFYLRITSSFTLVETTLLLVVSLLVGFSYPLHQLISVSPFLPWFGNYTTTLLAERLLFFSLTKADGRYSAYLMGGTGPWGGFAPISLLEV